MQSSPQRQEAGGDECAIVLWVSRALAAGQIPVRSRPSLFHPLESEFIHCTEERDKAWKEPADSGFVTKDHSGDNDDRLWLS